MSPQEAHELEEHDRVVRDLIANGRVDDAPLFRLRIVGGQVLGGVEHALADGSTLCGIPEPEVFVMRHLFHPTGRFACPDCAAAVRVGPE